MDTADLMHRNVITVLPGNSVRHAAQLMIQHGVSGLPVVDDTGRLVGMVSEGDLLRRIGANGPGDAHWEWYKAVAPEGLARDFIKSHSWRVGDVMSTPALTVTEDTSLAHVAELLATRNIKRLPVVRGNQVVGIISRADLLGWILADVPEPISKGDEALRISIEARLRDASPMFAEVPSVTVQNGFVQLRGKLGSKVERDAARVVIENVPGVAGFVDLTTQTAR